MRQRNLVTLGALALTAYVLVSFLTLPRIGFRPLFDGIAPPPTYNFVDPPKELIDQTDPPRPITSEISMTPEGSESKTVGTVDGQAILTVPLGGFREAVTIDITPEDAPFEARLPREINSNAYVITATGASGPATALKPFTLFLRYAQHADTVLLRDGSRWEELETQLFGQTFQVVTRTDRFGTYAAAGVPPDDSKVPLWLTGAILSVIAIVAAWIVDKVMRRRGKKASVRNQNRR